MSRRSEEQGLASTNGDIVGEVTRPDKPDPDSARMHRIHEHVALFGDEHGWNP